MRRKLVNVSSTSSKDMQEFDRNCVVCAEQWERFERRRSIRNEAGQAYFKKLGYLALLHTRDIFLEGGSTGGRPCEDTLYKASSS